MHTLVESTSPLLHASDNNVGVPVAPDLLKGLGDNNRITNNRELKQKQGLQLLEET